MAQDTTMLARLSRYRRGNKHEFPAMSGGPGSIPPRPVVGGPDSIPPAPTQPRTRSRYHAPHVKVFTLPQ